MDWLDRKIFQLKEKAAEYQRDGMDIPSRIYTRLADELAAEKIAFEEEEVGVAEAAALTGFDESSIRNMKSDGRLPVGKGGGIRRKDLPRKPGHGVAKAGPQRMRTTGGPDLAGEVLRDAAGGRR